MKQLLFTILLVSFYWFSANCQNANPYIGINMTPFEVGLHKTTNLEVVAGNASNDKIAPNSLRVTIIAGSNGTITGIAPKSDQRWKSILMTKGPGNTLVLGNNGNEEIGPFDLSKIMVLVEGVAVGGPETFRATISYNAGNTASGAKNTDQGNASAQDDKSTTSLVVLPAGPVMIPSLSATVNECNATISWQKTAVKTDSFEVQYATDDYTFTRTGAVSASAAVNNTYQFTNEQRGAAFYRLRLIDKSGKEYFTKSIRVETKCVPKRGF